MRWLKFLRALANAALVVGSLVIASCGEKTATTPSSTMTSTSTIPPANTGITISIVSNAGSQAFSPNPASLPAGQTVVFRNTTGSTHRIVADNGAWDTATLTAGAASAALPVGGTGAFHCAIHGSMVGSITIVQ